MQFDYYTIFYEAKKVLTTDDCNGLRSTEKCSVYFGTTGFC